MTQPSHPVRIVSRRAARKRAGKMRALWFVFGISFGVGCAAVMMPQSPDSKIAQNLQPEPVLSQSPQPAPSEETPAFETAESTAIASAAPASTPVQEAETPAQEVALITPDGDAVDDSNTEKSQAEPKVASAKPNAQANYPLELNVKVESGDTLITVLTDAGAPQDEAYNVLQAVKKQYDPKKLVSGQNVTVTIDKDASGTAVIKSVVLPLSLTASLEITRAKDNDFKVEKVDAPLERKLARAGGVIRSSLYETGTNASIPAGLLSEIITAYSYDVDFQRDIKEGDAIDVLYERFETQQGQVAKSGNLVYAELILGGEPMRIYRYVDGAGNADYYNQKGEGIRKALLRTPINGARITSGYGMRVHPVMGYSKMHRGVDFGAPTGTPIYAAGDGVVDFVGLKNGYGNYLRIRHNNKYSSAYGHISRFASGMASGKRVKQGQIVAYVGATGMATGPHLHYEILVNNEQVNPANVKFKTGSSLQGRELAAFRKSVEKIEAQLSTMPRGTKVAMADGLDSAVAQ